MAVKIKIKISEAELRKAGGVKKLVQERARRGAIVASEILRGELARRSPVNTGTLANSFLTKNPVLSRGGVSIKIGMIPYGQFVLKGHGGKKVKPPYGVLELWVRRRGIHRNLETEPWMAKLLPASFREGDGDSKRHSENKFTLAEKLVIATLLVMNKIANRGVEENDFFEPSMKFSKPRMLRAIEKGLGSK